MNVLVLTSINPVLAEDVYRRVTNELGTPDNVGFLCYPFFADMKCRMEDKPYMPVFFAMLKAAEKQEMKNKLFDKKTNIVIGNCYKSQDFDIIVAVDDMDRSPVDGEEIPFDTYISLIKREGILNEFKLSIDVDNLYTLDDAEIIIPTVSHAIEFIRGVIKDAK